jgi:hypothetical protein
MKSVILIIISFFIYCTSFSQCNPQDKELIHNAGFEDGDNAYPTNYAQFKKIDVWEDDEDFDGSYLKHSPDWFRDAYGFYYLSENNGNSVIYVNSYVGQCYVGMNFAELIEQKFFDHNKLTEGLNSMVTFYIRPIRVIPGMDDYFPHMLFDGAILRVYLANHKIKYMHSSNNDECDDVSWAYFQQGWGQSYIQISPDIIVTPNNYPFGEWTKVQFEFTAPESSYDWFAIEIQDLNGASNGWCHNYICIDEVSLMQRCENGCSSTAGVTSVCASTEIIESNPFWIRGLKNISRLKLKVWNTLGLITVLDIINPQDVIAWNGEINGSPMANAWYNYVIEATNDCGTVTYNDNSRYIIKTDNYDNSISQNQMYFNYNPVDKPPIPGCEGFINISNHTTIQDKTLYQPLLYKAINAVTTGPNVVIPNNNEVVFEAGESITLLPGFKAQAGSNFTARIASSGGNKSMTISEPIPNNSMNLQTLDLNIIPQEKSEKTSIQTSNLDETLITVSPNPSINNLYIDGLVNSTLVTVYDLSGKIVLSKQLNGNQLDISMLEKGLYFIKLNTEEGRVVRKFVKELG